MKTNLKKNYWILFLFQGIYFSGNSQGLQIGYFLQPQLSSIATTQNNNYESVNRNQTITALTGLTATYFFSKTIGIGSGITYGHEGQKFIKEKHYYGVPAEASSNHYVISVLKIPIQIKYLGSYRKIGWLLEGGPTLCYPLKFINKTDGGNLDYTDDYANLQIGFQIGTGLAIFLKNNLMVYIKPNLEFTAYSFKYTLNNQNKSYPLSKSLTSSATGLQFGITWHR